MFGGANCKTLNTAIVTTSIVLPFGIKGGWEALAKAFPFSIGICTAPTILGDAGLLNDTYSTLHQFVGLIYSKNQQSTTKNKTNITAPLAFLITRLVLQKD